MFEYPGLVSWLANGEQINGGYLYNLEGMEDESLACPQDDHIQDFIRLRGGRTWNISGNRLATRYYIAGLRTLTRYRR